MNYDEPYVVYLIEFFILDFEGYSNVQPFFRENNLTSVNFQVGLTVVNQRQTVPVQSQRKQINIRYERLFIYT